MHTQRSDNRHPLLLAAGQLSWIAVRLIRQADPGQPCHRFALHLLLFPPLGLSRRQQDIVHHRQVRKQLIALKYHSDPLTDPGQIPVPGADAPAPKPDLAVLGGLQGVDTAQQGAFSAAAGAHDDDDLALVHLQADIIQNRLAVIFLGQMLQRQNRLSHASHPHFFSRCRASRLTGQHSRKYSTNTVKYTPKAAFGLAFRFASIIC